MMVQKLMINTAVPACYIERGPAMCGLSRVMITNWLRAVNSGVDNLPQQYLDYMTFELLNAKEDDNLWSTIAACEHVWCSSAFEHPEGAELFIAAVKYTAEGRLTNKSFFDWTERKRAIYNLSRHEPAIEQIMLTLEWERSIRFYFEEELVAMMWKQYTPENRSP